MADEVRKVSQVIKLEENSYQGVADALGRDIESFIARLRKDPDLLAQEPSPTRWKPEVNADLVKSTYILLVKGAVLGMLHTGMQTEFADIDAAMLDETMPFEEAIESAQGRISITKAEYQALSDELKRQAFTVARLAQVDMIEKVRKLYLEQLEGDTSSLNGFLEAVKADVDAAGLPGYYENVYRTNIQSDYNAGRSFQLEANPPAALEFIGIEDVRQTEICASRSGLILPYDHPWWNDNWPPLHYQCRSTVRAIYQAEIDIAGIRILTSIPEGIEKPMAGFGKRPTQAPRLSAPSDSQLQRIEEYGLAKEIEDFDGTIA